MTSVGMLALPGGGAAQEPASCQSESVLTEIHLKNPEAASRILSEAARVPNSQAMLWRVERDGLAPSHIFGTIHVADKSVDALTPSTLKALRASKAVALEAAEVSRGALSYEMAQAGRFMSARDKPLQRFLDEDELKVVEKSLSAAGYPEDLALGIRPWVATLFLSGSDCQMKNQTAGLKPLDMLVSEEAKAASLTLTGLETMYEQFQSLASIPDEVQVAWLKASIASRERIDDVTHTIAELYRFRRINAVWELTRHLAPKVTMTDATLAAIRRGLVNDRNPRLFERSLPLIESGGAFIAVGALHVSGDDGLVARLARNGFRLIPIE